MNLITGRAGAAHITPRQDAMWHQGLIEMESCIFDAYENFAAEIITNNEVRIRSGVGMLQGRFFCIEPNTYDSAEIANGNQGEERIDLIVARITVDASANTQSASIEVIQGTPAAENPTTPEAVTGDLDAGDLIADYPLAVVRISGINITSVENTFNAGWLSLPQTRQNINFIGRNPIASVSEDTPANWKTFGTGIAYISGNNIVVDSPSNYGIVQNMVYGSEVRQVWFGMYNGDIYHRGGHVTSGWSGTWKKMLDEQTMLDMVYPVGAVYISYTSTSPAELFGGTWIAITGRFPYFNAGTATGGSNTTTQTVAQMAKHSHQIGYRSIYAGTGNYLALTAQASETATANSHDTGGSESQNNMPAYQTLYAWRRTA